MSATMPRWRRARIKRAASHRRATLRSRYKHKTHSMPVSADGSVVNICYSARYRFALGMFHHFLPNMAKTNLRKWWMGVLRPFWPGFALERVLPPPRFSLWVQEAVSHVSYTPTIFFGSEARGWWVPVGSRRGGGQGITATPFPHWFVFLSCNCSSTPKM